MQGMAQGVHGGLLECIVVCWYVPVTILNVTLMFQVLDHSGGRIDLSPLRKNSDNWFTQPTSLGVKYYINVCGPLNSMHTHKCTGM